MVRLHRLQEERLTWCTGVPRGHGQGVGRNQNRAPAFGPGGEFYADETAGFVLHCSRHALEDAGLRGGLPIIESARMDRCQMDPHE